MIRKVLVANRGEIARRVFATCRRLGIGTVAVYTDPDAAAPHVAEADDRVRLEGRTGYLDAAQLIAAAKASGADAIHPGYGFLSENPDFAAAVQDAGLTWIGPPVKAVQAMGSKIEAKKLMSAAGVPVLTELDPETVTADQLPVLIKASAGGGGRGMRIVRDEGEVSRAFKPEGFGVKAPFVTSINQISIRQQTAEDKAECYSADLQQITVDLKVLFRIPESSVVKLFQDYYGNPFESLVAPRVQEALKEVAALQSAEQIVKNREQIKTRSLEIARRKLGQLLVRKHARACVEGFSG